MWQWYGKMWMEQWEMSEWENDREMCMWWSVMIDWWIWGSYVHRCCKGLEGGWLICIFLGGKTLHGHRGSITLIASASCEQQLAIAWTLRDLKGTTLGVTYADSALRSQGLCNNNAWVKCVWSKHRGNIDWASRGCLTGIAYASRHDFVVARGDHLLAIASDTNEHAESWQRCPVVSLAGISRPSATGGLGIGIWQMMKSEPQTLLTRLSETYINPIHLPLRKLQQVNLK